MHTEELLNERYGALLTLEDLAEVLKRTPPALRSALRAERHTLAPLADRRLKIGRRMYFRTGDVADFIDDRNG